MSTRESEYHQRHSFDVLVRYRQACVKMFCTDWCQYARWPVSRQSVKRFQWWLSSPPEPAVQTWQLCTSGKHHSHRLPWHRSQRTKRKGRENINGQKAQKFILIYQEEYSLLQLQRLHRWMCTQQLEMQPEGRRRSKQHRTQIPVK